MRIDLIAESEDEKRIVEQAMSDWFLYGQMHLTNNGGRGVAVLNPTRITYHPEYTDDELQRSHPARTGPGPAPGS